MSFFDYSDLIIANPYYGFTSDTNIWTPKGICPLSEFKNGDNILVRSVDDWCDAFIYVNNEKQNIVKINVISEYNEKNFFYTTIHQRWIVINNENEKYIKNTSQLTKQDNIYNNENEKWFVESIENTNRYENTWYIIEPKYRQFTLDCGIITTI